MEIELVIIHLVFANGLGDLGSIPVCVIPKTLKMIFDTALLLTLSSIRYISKLKWRNPEKGVAPSLTLWCSSYRKESLLVALDYGCQLDYLLFTYYNSLISEIEIFAL